ASDQRIKYTSPVEWLIRLILLSADGPTGGVEPDVWPIEWKPLKHQSEKEIAETRQLVAEADEKYVDMGMPVDRLLEDRFGGDTYSMETTFDRAEFERQRVERERHAEEMRAAEIEAAKAGGEGKEPSEDEDGDRE